MSSGSELSQEDEGTATEVYHVISDYTAVDDTQVSIIPAATLTTFSGRRRNTVQLTAAAVC